MRYIGVRIRDGDSNYWINLGYFKFLLSGRIARLYAARWEIELIFKELKSHYRMVQIPSASEIYLPL